MVFISVSNFALEDTNGRSEAISLSMSLYQSVSALVLTMFTSWHFSCSIRYAGCRYIVSSFPSLRSFKGVSFKSWRHLGKVRTALCAPNLLEILERSDVCVVRQITRMQIHSVHSGGKSHIVNVALRSGWSTSCSLPPTLSGSDGFYLLSYVCSGWLHMFGATSWRLLASLRCRKVPMRRLWEPLTLRWKVT